MNSSPNSNHYADSPSREKRIRKHVKAIKAWYWSIPTYVLGTLMMIGLIYVIKQGGAPDFVIYVLALGPVLWWLMLLVQGANLFLPKPNFIASWEKRQIQKYMKDE